MELEAIEFKQNGRVLYSTCMNALDLVDEDKVKTDMWQRANPDGYQRRLSPTRTKSFARFVGKMKGVSPLSVLLSVRGEVKFERKHGNYGKLFIPDSEVLWRVDGQHRLDGLHVLLDTMDYTGEFYLPVIIMCPSLWGDTDPKWAEAKQFLIINRTAKGVRADLAERFLGKLKTELEERGQDFKDLPRELTKEIDWMPAAIEITEKVNDTDSTWTGRIRFPNESKGETIVSQRQFSHSLEPILKDGRFKEYSEEEIAKMLGVYWAAIKELCQEAFEDPVDYVIMKTTGTEVLHAIFPAVASYCVGKRLTKDNLKAILEGMREMKSEFWHSDGQAGVVGTNRKSFAILEGMLMQSLRENNQESVEPIRPFQL